MQVAPYGSWRSPISTDLIVAQSIGLGGPRLDGDVQYWSEARPGEGGRVVIVQRAADGIERDINPAPFNARTRVHEYGGGSWFIDDGRLYFTNFADQQLYVQGVDDAEPQQLTQAPRLRFANGIMDRVRRRIVCIVEDHGEPDAECRNYLGAVDLDSGRVSVLHEGHDFYSSPCLDPEGRHMAWITWDHPDMPWDAGIVWLATINDNQHDNDDKALTNVEAVAGGDAESVQQPRFAPDGTLYYISDRNGWWNIYRHGEEDSICPKDAEFGSPHWTFGLSSYRFVDAHRLVCSYNDRNQSRLARLDAGTGELRHIDLPFTSIGSLQIDGDRCTFIGASPTAFPAVVNLDLGNDAFEIVRRSCNVELDPGYYSVPDSIEFETTGGEVAYGFHYPPANKDYVAPDGEKPPLIVMVHGGPTGATDNALSLAKQFWTSRGFALLDVNYRGSTGYGREYRQKLNGAWGIVDVEDTVYGARHLAESGLCDPQRLAIRGGSAGGYTTLAALAFEDTFRAGASHYGVADLEALAKDTHKFESRYLDSMIGRYPEDIDIYKQRSPINHVDGLNCPVIFFQGLEDRVVPPNQAEMMVAALDRKGLPVAYVPFEGEQHGFRRAANIKRALDLELYFYARVFGFTTADQIEPI